ncbi:SMP-30/gluconolactonase/LRE family protein [Mangrovicoccus algicola]|uniref:SMP-30/gluconolactonase/LRE family protein n=1 Tax=Mangrovicoccus algicola TaxID=2771008 RepID=A0A8J6YXZ4_9RHOB|nr:SMP-30/gluconolactonase/LRE family protein [Mangrovicoccus algicola]MBE3638599.1 SMP-30/gluconolactonase/LRE family protein [Mangrovicoccus algicola]
MEMEIYDARPCLLGEGPLWHPLRNQLFWFDIIGNRILSRQGDRPLEWRFDEHLSAAGWIDEHRLLIATETALRRFDIATGEHEPVCPLEADLPGNRSNDGRADPMGGFWIGTMAKAGGGPKGAIWRYHKGVLEKLYGDITTSNAICFGTDGRTAYFTDTPTLKVMRVELDAEGWPAGPPEVFLDLAGTGHKADGAVIDSQNHFWTGQWGSGRVARYTPEGVFDRAIAVPGLHSSCPAFGGPDRRTLFCTSALQSIAEPDAAQGLTYVIADAGVAGQAEHRVIA